jgi:hypothetical protein
MDRTVFLAGIADTHELQLERVNEWNNFEKALFPSSKGDGASACCGFR